MCSVQALSLPLLQDNNVRQRKLRENKVWESKVSIPTRGP